MMGTRTSSDPPLVVALTGGIGSGKSAVAQLFAGWGAAVVDADQLARRVVAPGSTGLKETVALFGNQVLNADGTLNRATVAALIFATPSKRHALEQILHPLIRQAWLDELHRLSTLQPAPVLIVYSLPLYFESGVPYPEIHRVVHVTAPEAQRIARVIARDGCSEEHVRQRMRAQLSDHEKNARSDFVLVNDSSTELLQERSRAIFEELIKPINQPPRA
jgi:dephospho-CoA kinase